MVDNMKELLFSVSIKDCEVQTFRSGGAGGQNQNKRDSGVRVIHHLSGARGESREHKSQLHNKKAAFIRMTQTQKFKLWQKLESCRKMGQESIEEIVEREMQPHNLKIEVKNEKNQWQKI